LLDSAHLGWHIGLEPDFLHPPSALAAADLIHRESAIGGDLFERHAALGVVPQQLQHGRNLLGAKLVKQLVGVLFRFACVRGHFVLPARRPF